MNKIDLAAGWSTIWNALTGAVPNLQTILGVIAAFLAAVAVGKFIKDKRKSSGNPKELGWVLALAALVGLPNLIIPLALDIASWVVNFVIGILQAFQS